MAMRSSARVVPVASSAPANPAAPVTRVATGAEWTGIVVAMKQQDPKLGAELEAGRIRTVTFVADGSVLECPYEERSKSWNEYTFAERAKMLTEKPAEAERLKALHQGMIEGARAAIAAAKTRGARLAGYETLRKLEGQ
ncbi:MAG TPA: hypothetical protein VK550_09230 [Polyangiaceae bacterium]|nr:hypothetical protein [Polyangiaceae bacterium]